jgi:hypothetical protein
MSKNNKFSDDNDEIELLDLDEPSYSEQETEQEEIFDEPQKEVTSQEEKIDNHVTNSDDKKANNRRLTLFLITMLLLLVAMISVRYIFFDDGQESQYQSNVVSGPITYKVFDFNSNEYIYKMVENAAIIDTVNLKDTDTEKNIVYEFRISEGKVIVSNGEEEYKINKISNASRLLITNLGGVLEYTSAFVLTSNGKVYSISLYDNKYNLITDCSGFEKTTTKYDVKEKIGAISTGVYKAKDDSTIENVVLLTAVDSKQYVLKK